MIPIGLRLVQAAHTIHYLELYTCTQSASNKLEQAVWSTFSPKFAAENVPRLHDAPDGSGAQELFAHKNGRRARYAVKLFCSDHYRLDGYVLRAAKAMLDKVGRRSSSTPRGAFGERLFLGLMPNALTLNDYPVRVLNGLP
jgi:hypothetical protein